MENSSKATGFTRMGIQLVWRRQQRNVAAVKCIPLLTVLVLATFQLSLQKWLVGTLGLQVKLRRTCFRRSMWHPVLASPGPRCYSWCHVSTNLHLAYDNIVCPGVKNNNTEAVPWICLPCCIFSCCICQRTWRRIAFFPNPLYCWACLLAMSSDSDCRYCSFQLAACWQEQAGKCMLGTTSHRCFSTSWGPVGCGSHFCDISAHLCLTMLPDLSPAEQQTKT